ncbi:MAG: anti-sigma F factor [Ruminococcus sp.]|nr:anti-sigma F factor [Ruminococcus sp.]
MKTIKNSLKLVFPSNSENESLARMAVSSFLSVGGVPVGDIAELKTAVSEGVTNAIVHGYRGSHGNVTLEMKLFASGRVKIVIRDKGVGIEDIELAMEPLYTTAPEEERAGLGFAIMKSFCDKLRVRSKVGGGTVVTLEKYISDGVNDDC